MAASFLELGFGSLECVAAAGGAQFKNRDYSFIGRWSAARDGWLTATSARRQQQAGNYQEVHSLIQSSCLASYGYL